MAKDTRTASGAGQPGVALVMTSPSLIRHATIAYRVEAFFIKGNRIALVELQERLTRPAGLIVMRKPPGKG